MANTVVIQSLLYGAADVAIVAGTVNGVSTTYQTWQSAISKLPNIAAVQNFLGAGLVNAAAAAAPTTITTYNGTVTL